MGTNFDEVKPTSGRSVYSADSHGSNRGGRACTEKQKPRFCSDGAEIFRDLLFHNGKKATKCVSKPILKIILDVKYFFILGFRIEVALHFGSSL